LLLSWLLLNSAVIVFDVRELSGLGLDGGGTGEEGGDAGPVGAGGFESGTRFAGEEGVDGGGVGDDGGDGRGAVLVDRDGVADRGEGGEPLVAVRGAAPLDGGGEAGVEAGEESLDGESGGAVAVEEQAGGGEHVEQVGGVLAALRGGGRAPGGMRGAACEGLGFDVEGDTGEALGGGGGRVEVYDVLLQPRLGGGPLLGEVEVGGGDEEVGADAVGGEFSVPGADGGGVGVDLEAVAAVDAGDVPCLEVGDGGVLRGGAGDDGHLGPGLPEPDAATGLDGRERGAGGRDAGSAGRVDGVAAGQGAEGTEQGERDERTEGARGHGDRLHESADEDAERKRRERVLRG